MQKEKREHFRGDRGVGSPGGIRQAEVGGCAVSLSFARKTTITRREGQQQVLRAIFAEIRNSVKELIGTEMDALARDFPDMDDMEVKKAIEYLAREYDRLDEPWVFLAN